MVYRGRGIDWGFSEAPWPLLPGGPDRVLVLGAKAVKRVAEGKARSAPWLAVDVTTGRISRTEATWTPPGRLLGWWAFVQPESHTPPPTTSPDCSKPSWTYP